MESKWLNLYNKRDNYNVTLKKLKEHFESTYELNEQSKIGEIDQCYEELQVIGKGGFGTVKLYRNVDSNQYIAVKILIKELIVKSKQIKHVCSEKRILQSVCFPFLIHLEFSIKNATYLYLGLPFVNGGEMYYYHQQVGQLQEVHAKFYATQIFLALEYLHNCEVIYRDLKTENILIDDKGYVKITDFGFCKKIEGRTWTFCGTPEYLAPEVLKSKSYGKPVDWWAFGVLVYEFVAGKTPFYSPNEMKMYEQICEADYEIPSNFSSELKNLVSNLLQVDCTKRIGNLKNGSNDIREHVWFKNTDWNGILSKDYLAYYVPQIEREGDVSNFMPVSESEIPPLNPKQDTFDKYAAMFSEF